MSLSRIQKFQRLLTEKNLDGFFVTNPKNIFYLTGFIGISPHERESSLLVTPQKAFLFIPQMYEEKARKVTQTLEKNSLELLVDHERHGLLTSFTRLLKPENKIGVEAHNLTLAEFEKIKLSTTAHLVPEKLFLEDFRTKKDVDEILFLQKACEITDQTFEKIVTVLKHSDYTELTELDITDAMRSISRELGAEGNGFDPIVACGSGSSEPHYVTGKKHLTKNEPLLLDFGFVYGGYTADLSRTLFLGKAPEEFKKMYSMVKMCNELCIHSCKSGVNTKELYTLSREFFQKENLEKNYLHSLGHGVGLDVHESPSVGPGPETILEEGMVITIEPGLYFTEKYGIRIEDVVVVEKDGCRVLSSQSSKELIEIE